MLNNSTNLARMSGLVKDFVFCGFREWAWLAPPRKLEKISPSSTFNAALMFVCVCLWLHQAEHELRVAQTEFDRQAEVTRLLLEGISSTHVSICASHTHTTVHFKH